MGGIGGVASALVGMTILMVTGVLTWKECLAEGPAWDTLVWFAALIAMANFLNKFGLIPWFSNLVVSFVQPLGLAWQPLADGGSLGLRRSVWHRRRGLRTRRNDHPY